MNARPYFASDEGTKVVDAIEAGEAIRDGASVAVIDSALKLSIGGLNAYFYSQWRDELVDLLVIAAAVEHCDLSTPRPAWGWARSFDLRVAVHDVDRWSEEAVKHALEEALTFLTGDKWSISFTARNNPVARVAQIPLGLEVSDKIIMPYSDGVDSRAVSALVDASEGGGLVRVRLGTKGSDRRSRDPVERRFMTVPYEVKLGKRQRVESSARSRGFKFAIITGIAAILAGVDRIVVSESGQGSLGPILVAVGQAYPDYRVHPAFSRKVEALLEALTGAVVRYEYPRIWSTKGETIAAASALEHAPKWIGTRSCWQDSRQVNFDGKRRQCGICAACMLRRMSMHSAGISEPPSTYIWENLSAEDIQSGTVDGFVPKGKAAIEYAIAGVLHLDHLAAISGSEIHRPSTNRVVQETALALGLDGARAEALSAGLLARHREEWLSFQSSLGRQSFVAKIAQVSPWQQ